jgi:hypothetical protein
MLIQSWQSGGIHDKEAIDNEVAMDNESFNSPDGQRYSAPFEVPFELLGKTNMDCMAHSGWGWEAKQRGIESCQAVLKVLSRDAECETQEDCRGVKEGNGGQGGSIEESNSSTGAA